MCSLSLEGTLCSSNPECCLSLLSPDNLVKWRGSQCTRHGIVNDTNVSCLLDDVDAFVQVLQLLCCGLLSLVWKGHQRANIRSGLPSKPLQRSGTGSIFLPFFGCELLWLRTSLLSYWPRVHLFDESTLSHSDLIVVLHLVKLDLLAPEDDRLILGEECLASPLEASTKLVKFKVLPEGHQEIVYVNDHTDIEEARRITSIEKHAIKSVLLQAHLLGKDVDHMIAPGLRCVREPVQVPTYLVYFIWKCPGSMLNSVPWCLHEDRQGSFSRIWCPL